MDDPGLSHVCGVDGMMAKRQEEDHVMISAELHSVVMGIVSSKSEMLT
jgi:hypothetical protein